MSRNLRDLNHVAERARLHGIAIERLQRREPALALTPCPVCRDGSHATATWDGLGVIFSCRRCDDPDAIREILLREPEPRGMHGSSLGDPLVITPLEDFAAVEEPGVEPIVGDDENALIPENGDVMFFGDGGAGKTTLAIDLACHIGAGDPWLGIPIPTPRRVLLVENEGPRPLYRRKLRRKQAGWTGSPLERRVSVFVAPWAGATFADEPGQRLLAEAVRRSDADVVVIGPVSRSGMNEAGTLQEVREFMRLVAAVRELAERPITFILIHHEGKSGKVSGAWEGSGDTLFHVTGQGRGKTRLFIQKARWASSHQAITLQLVWTAGEGYAVEDEPELTDDDIAEKIRAVIGERPGINWTKVEEATPGMARKRRREVRDRLLNAAVIVNIAKIDGVDTWLGECPERKASRLYLGDDPTIQHLRPDPGADRAQTAPAPGVAHRPASAPCAPPLEGRNGVGADPPPPASSKSAAREPITTTSDDRDSHWDDDPPF